jgi:hypothetical protein
MKAKVMKLAIDFGTTNTVIARWKDGISEIVSIPSLSIKSDTLPALVPSLVCVQDGQDRQPLSGQIVCDRGFDYQHDNRLFRNFKRGIVAQPSPQPREIDGVFWGDPEAGHAFLRGLIAALPFTQDGLPSLSWADCIMPTVGSIDSRDQSG